MVSITFITSYCIIVFISLATESANETIPGNSQNDRLFDFTNLPLVHWLYEQQTSEPSEVESNSKGKSHFAESELRDFKDQDETNTPKIIIDTDYSPDEHVKVEKVDDILNVIEKSSNEEKKQFMPFLQDFESTITHEPARYARIILKNMLHVVDMGLFKSKQRERNAEKVKSLFERLLDFLKAKAAQVTWAQYERTKEGDKRIWKEEEALERLHQMEKEYKTMDKKELVKDITSLCMQPLYTRATYEKIVRFLDKLKNENIADQQSLDKAFKYVDYKGEFALKYGINEMSNGEIHGHGYNEHDLGHKQKHEHEHGYNEHDLGHKHKDEHERM